MLIGAYQQAWAVVRASGSPIAGERYSAEALSMLAQCIVDAYTAGEADPRNLVSEGIGCLARARLSNGGHVTSAGRMPVAP